MQNTFGTDINAVLQHVNEIPARHRPKVVLIATDGYVGQARNDLVTGLGRPRAVVALTESGHAADLKPWVQEITQLPKL